MENIFNEKNEEEKQELENIKNQHIKEEKQKLENIKNQHTKEEKQELENIKNQHIKEDYKNKIIKKYIFWFDTLSIDTKHFCENNNTIINDIKNINKFLIKIMKYYNEINVGIIDTNNPLLQKKRQIIRGNNNIFWDINNRIKYSLTYEDGDDENIDIFISSPIITEEEYDEGNLKNSILVNDLYILSNYAPLSKNLDLIDIKNAQLCWIFNKYFIDLGYLLFDVFKTNIIEEIDIYNYILDGYNNIKYDIINANYNYNGTRKKEKDILNINFLRDLFASLMPQKSENAILALEILQNMYVNKKFLFLKINNNGKYTISSYNICDEKYDIT